MQFLYFLAIIIGPLVKVLYNLIGNYAVTMIVATLIMKLLLFPLAGLVDQAAKIQDENALTI